MAKLYMEYLNSPLGNGVLSRLKEGDSFSIVSTFDTLQVTKNEGKAVVEVIPKLEEKSEPRVSYTMDSAREI